MSRTLAALCAVPMVAAALSMSTPVRAAAQDPESSTPAFNARSDQREFAKRPGDDRAARQGIEVVESAARFIPLNLTAQRTETMIIDTFTTTKPGRLLVTKSMELSATCTPASGVMYFLILDGVPLRNSTVFARAGFVGQMSGVTTNTVAAGTHTVTVGETCTVPGAYPSGASVTIIGLTTAVVLP
ncbi:MAG TPA: hypothetical protein VMF13_13710 [Luteitalea sp.]|nr:hypothetical protein [Luteitalea sp.]